MHVNCRLLLLLFFFLSLLLVEAATETAVVSRYQNQDHILPQLLGFVPSEKTLVDAILQLKLLVLSFCLLSCKETLFSFF